MELEKLIPLLRANGVSRYKAKGIELEFGPVVQMIQAPGVKIQEETPKQEISVDEANFKADETMKFDDILHWSSAADASEKEAMPLTGDAPLGV